MKHHLCTLVALLMSIFVLSVFAACGDGEQETPTSNSTTPVEDTSGESAPHTPISSPVPTRAPSPSATPALPAGPTPEPTPTPAEDPASTGKDQGAWPPAVPATVVGEPVHVGNLVEVAAGAGHSCGLREDGSAVCWGRDYEGQASVPVASFVSLGAYRLQTCGALTEGGIQCWGQAPLGNGEVLLGEEEFVSISVASDHLCGLGHDGVVLCWSSEHGRSMRVESVPEGEFLSVDVGHNHACGARAEGGVVCWGGDYGEITPILAQESFSSVRTSSHSYSCGLRSDGAVDCWGLDGGEFARKQTPIGRFKAISLSDMYACGLRTDGEITCWGEEGFEYVGSSVLPAGSYTALSIHNNNACALRDDGSVVCWGEGDGAMPPGGIGINEWGDVYSIAAWREGDVTTYTIAAQDHTCQWRTAPDWEDSYSRFCWGRADIAGPNPAGPTYGGISALDSHVCAVQSDGKAICWGRGDTYSSGDSMFPSFGPEPTNPSPPDIRSRPEVPPSDLFSDIAVGRYHTCGIRADDSVICWGGSHNSQATSPGGEFTAISAGEQHTCGLRPDGQAVCWGKINYHGVRTEPPAGEYRTISAGDDSTCGVMADGLVQCWGDGLIGTKGEYIAYDPGRMNACGVTGNGLAVCQDVFWGTHAAYPHLGALTDVSVGSHSCGLRRDGTLICWDGRVDTITPPGGTFSLVSVGNGYACALGTNGAVVCWGHNDNSNPIDIPPGTWNGETLYGMRSQGGKRVSIPSPPPAAAEPLVPLDAPKKLAPIGRDGEILPSCGELCSDEFWYEDGSLGSVRALLEGGADLAGLGDRGETALHWAVRNADTPEITSLLLEHAADPNARSYAGASVLMAAAGAGNSPEVIQELLDYGAAVNVGKTNHGETELSAAVRTAAYIENAAVVRLLLENGADATVKYQDEGLTILHLYLFGLVDYSDGEASDPEIVKMLLDYGSDPVGIPTGFLFELPVLSLALYFVPDKEIVTAIVEHGGSEHLQEPWGSTALYLAVHRDDPEIVELLLKHDADPSSQVHEGNTPLHAAIPASSFRPPDAGVIRLLLANGANVNARNDAGETPLHRAMDLPYADVVRLLLEGGADLSAVDDKGNTPLHRALRRTHGQAADADLATELLLEQGASVAAVNKDGETPLYIAVVFSSPESVELLLAHGAEPNATGPSSRTPLHSAALLAWEPDIFSALISAGGDVNARSDAGETPLHLLFAGERWYTLPEEDLHRIISVLLGAGADSEASNDRGETPCDAAGDNDGTVRTLLCQ